MPKRVIPPNKIPMKPTIPKILNKKSITQGIPRIPKQNTEKILVENFVALQKVMVNLSIKMDNLTNQISSLLSLFEISAKALAEKGGVNIDNSQVIKKVDNLLNQNKTIARGISLLHENPNQLMPQQQRPAIRLPPQMNKLPSQQPRGGYTQSLSKTKEEE